MLKQHAKINLKLGVGSIEARNRNTPSVCYFNIAFENLKYIAIVEDRDNALSISDSSGSTYVVGLSTRRDEIINELENRVNAVGLKVAKDQGHVRSTTMESLLTKSGFLITSNVGSTAINTDDYLNIYDWSRSGPRIGKHLPLSTFKAVRINRVVASSLLSNGQRLGLGPNSSSASQQNVFIPH